MNKLKFQNNQHQCTCHCARVSFYNVFTVPYSTGICPSRQLFYSDLRCLFWPCNRSSCRRYRFRIVWLTDRLRTVIIPTLIIKGIMALSSVILPTAQASLSTCSRFVQPLPALSVSLSCCRLFHRRLHSLRQHLYRCDSDSGPCYGRHCRHRSLLCHRFRYAAAHLPKYIQRLTQR